MTVCLVTGAAQGIGEAIARRFAEDGARVAALDTERAEAEFAIVADVREPSAVEGAVARIESELGPIDVLVNAAGILRTGLAATFDDCDWADTFAVNATGVFIVSRAVARRMMERRSGVIVTVGSNAAGVPRMDMAAYAASKAAAAHFTRCLGLELASFGIRCNVVSPGSTDTPMQRSLWNDASAPDRVVAGSPEKFRVGIPLGKIARAEDVAEAVAFLASARASHITMQDLYVDGGATLRS